MSILEGFQPGPAWVSLARRLGCPVDGELISHVAKGAVNSNQSFMGWGPLSLKTLHEIDHYHRALFERNAQILIDYVNRRSNQDEVVGALKERISSEFYGSAFEEAEKIREWLKDPQNAAHLFQWNPQAVLANPERGLRIKEEEVWPIELVSFLRQCQPPDSLNWLREASLRAALASDVAMLLCLGQDKTEIRDPATNQPVNRAEFVLSQVCLVGDPKLLAELKGNSAFADLDHLSLIRCMELPHGNQAVKNQLLEYPQFKKLGFFEIIEASRLAALASDVTMLECLGHGETEACDPTTRQPLDTHIPRAEVVLSQVCLHGDPQLLAELKGNSAFAALDRSSLILCMELPHGNQAVNNQLLEYPQFKKIEPLQVLFALLQ